MNICIFEDEGYKKLYPLTLFRPSFELRCGVTLLREKIARAFPDAEISFLTRDYIAPTFRSSVPGARVNDMSSLKEKDVLFINGRILADAKFNISSAGDEETGICGKTVVYARVKKTSIENYASLNTAEFTGKILSSLPQKEIKEVSLITNLWDLINNNGEAIANDFKFLSGKIEGELSPHTAIVGEKSRVHIGKGAQVHPFVALDTTGGPVIIDEEAMIYPNSRIEGPSWVGKKSKVVGGKVREGTSIGPACVIGGEVEETIFQGYSNKYHDGFIGHSYICEWVNLGALTTTSDMKNNYNPVKIYVNGKFINTGTLKIGSFIGDHSKLGIGTLLNTGTVIGTCSNIFSGGMPPKSIPSFSWGFTDAFTEFKLEKVIETAKKVMARREVEHTPEYTKLIKKVYELTARERKEW